MIKNINSYNKSCIRIRLKQHKRVFICRGCTETVASYARLASDLYLFIRRRQIMHCKRAVVHLSSTDRLRATKPAYCRNSCGGVWAVIQAADANDDTVFADLLEEQLNPERKIGA